MKKLVIISCLFVSVGAMAQVSDTVKMAHTDTSVHAPLVMVVNLPPMPDTSVHIYAPAVVPGIENKIYQYQRYNHGTSPGYRVQINFSQDENAVDKMQADFAGKYAGIPSYISYKQPYFRLSAGDFRSKLQAVDFLEKIRKDYPGAFVVADKIVPPPLQ